MNLYGSWFAAQRELPLFLDSIGTILTAVTLGPWFGAFTGFLAKVIAGLSENPSAIPFGIANGAVGVAAGFLYMIRGFKDYRSPLFAAMILAVISLVLSTTISAFLYGGYTGGSLDFYHALLIREGFPSLFSAFLIRIPAETADKLISTYLVWIMVRLMPRRFLGKASNEIQ